MRNEFIFILIFLTAICLIAPIAAEDNNTQAIDDIGVSFNDTVYKEDLGYIDVELPQNVSGNLKATINDVEFYNENVSSSVKVPITIPQKAIPLIVPNKDTDHTTYHINLLFNNTLLKSNHTLKVMKVPSNYTLRGFPSEILKDNPEGYVSLYFPESANGEIKIFIDGKYAFNLTASHYTFLNATKFNSLALGNHNVTVMYSGDSYYRKFNRTFNFSVVDMTIHIPSNIVLDHDDCITAKTLDNRDGTVTVYVDNQMVFKDKLDKRGEFLHSLFDDVTCGEHIIEVQYNAGNFTKSKRVISNVSYYVDIMNDQKFRYGEQNYIIIIVLEDFNKSLINISIDGVRYTDFEIDNSGWIELDISKLEMGDHVLKFDFSGDRKYTSWSAESNFTIEYRILLPYTDYLEPNVGVYLALPHSAKGNLEVYVDSKLYKSVKLDEGIGFVDIDDLVPNKYNISARYAGDDINVTEVSEMVDYYPKFIDPGDVYCGEDKSIVIKTSKKAIGKAIFSIGNKNITVPLKDGKASLSLKNLKVGYYEDVTVSYIGGNGFNATFLTDIEISPSVKLTSIKITGTKAKMKVLINSKVAKSTYVKFKVDKKTKKIKTDKNGFAAFKLNPGKHTVTAYYKNAIVKKTINVPSLVLNSVKVKKSAKKVVLTVKLTKKLKNKVIKFKFNGKTLKVKTNAKGIAKATFKTSNLKAGKKLTYSATYLKDTVKKTVKVSK